MNTRHQRKLTITCGVENLMAAFFSCIANVMNSWNACVVQMSPKNGSQRNLVGSRERMDFGMSLPPRIYGKPTFPASLVGRGRGGSALPSRLTFTLLGIYYLGLMCFHRALQGVLF